MSVSALVVLNSFLLGVVLHVDNVFVLSVSEEATVFMSSRQMLVSIDVLSAVRFDTSDGCERSINRLPSSQARVMKGFSFSNLSPSGRFFFIAHHEGVFRNENLTTGYMI